MDRIARKKAGGEGGFVLIVTLLVTAMLIAVVVEFAYSIFVSTSRSANFSDSQRTGILAANGVELAHSAMGEVLKVRPNLVMDAGGLAFSRREGDMTVSITVVDELGKLSPRVVYTNTGVENDRVYDSYERLLAELKLDADLIHKLADWIDSDDEPRVYGAEGPDHYLRLPAPYEPSNTDITSMEEMGMIEGHTIAVVDRLKPHVSPHNTAGYVNVNTAPREVIMALSGDITRQLADELIRYRKENPFKDRSDVMKVPGYETIGFNLQDKIVVHSDVFRVYSKAASRDTIREVEAVFRVGGGMLYWREY